MGCWTSVEQHWKKLRVAVTTSLRTSGVSRSRPWDARGQGWAAVPRMSPQVPPEVWAADEQDLLLLLEPEEFLQGVIQLTQVLGEG